MSEENQASNEPQGNGALANVGGMFTKEMVINILQKRADTAFKNQPYEKRKIADAIYIIETLMPPSDFPDW